MTPRVERREWDSNPATTFAGLLFNIIRGKLNTLDFSKCCTTTIRLEKQFLNII